jgi:3-methyladenine DNA glycosylase AlkC
MGTLLKDLYSPAFYDSFSEVLAATIPEFDITEFQRRIFIPEFTALELKQRMTHTAEVLGHFLADDFGAAAKTICQIIEHMRVAGSSEQVVEYMFLPEYVEKKGIDDYATSTQALEYITQFTSCEFAVRPFILRYGQPMLEQMLQWSQHQDNRVRRLASEGSRPRLPWAMALPALKRDPTPLLPILENLKLDECEIVRRSVANNLNDISKDNPRIVIGLAKQWMGCNAHTDALLKHGCRTLLKQGNPEILGLFGFDKKDVELEKFKVQTPRVAMGEQLEFSFAVSNQGNKTKKLRIEYAIHFLKNNGMHSKKVFKISEREIAANGRFEFAKKHRFKPITTRRYYSGKHRVSVIINGIETRTMDFDLDL